MYREVKMVLAALCFLSLTAIADNERHRSGLKVSDEILFTDVDKDGDPDVLERWYNGKRCRWLDENDDMSSTDRIGDMVGDCLQVDMNGDGVYDGPEDMTVKWADNNGSGSADMQIIVINPKAGEEKKFGGLAHYMVFLDVDNDGVMAYIDWSNFSFPCWRHTGKGNFSPDYNGDSIFLKVHMAPFATNDARLNWENPFAFYDMDDDGCTEMAVRLVDNPLFDGTLDSAYVTYDLDNDSQRDNEFDFDMTLRFEKVGAYDYSRHVNKYPAMKAPAWALPYFQRTEYRTIDELIFVPHDQCYETVFETEWDRCLFVFDEDDDDCRWERVELYYPNDPYKLRTENSYEANRESKSGPMNVHAQSDSLGDRGEFDMDNSGRGKLYVSPWDNRLHLFGAEWGAWTIDSQAQYNGAAALPSGASDKLAKEVEGVVLYYDTDKNGFFDLVRFDYNGNGEPELVVNLLEYGTDVCELIDPSEAGWQGLHEQFKSHAKKSWQQANTLYRVFWRTGLSTKAIDDLAFASSTWQQYFHGAKLKEAIFRKCAEAVKDDKMALNKLYSHYFGGNIEHMAAWIQALGVSGDSSSNKLK